MTKWGLHCFVYPLLFGKYLTCPEKKTLYIGIRQAWFMFGVDDAWWWICRMMNDNEWWLWCCCCWWWRLWFMTMIPGSNLLRKLPVAFFVGYSLHWLKGACHWHMWSTRTFSSLMEVYPGLSSEVSFFCCRACTLLTWFCIQSLLISIFIVFFLRLVLSLYEFVLVFFALGWKTFLRKTQEKGVLNTWNKWKALYVFFFFGAMALPVLAIYLVGLDFSWWLTLSKVRSW